jgi:hypothetical protein
MPETRRGQAALMTLPIPGPTPYYQPVRIIGHTPTQVHLDNGRKFRRADLTAIGYTEDEKRAGAFVARLIPDTHPYYRTARDQHIANLLRTTAIQQLRDWQRYPYSHTAARRAASALTTLADHLDPKD